MIIETGVLEIRSQKIFLSSKIEVIKNKKTNDCNKMVKQGMNHL
jgi:hypothetical protein